MQFRLSIWLCIVILVIALATGVFSFVSAYQEAIELQDEQLRQMAALINRRGLPSVDVAPGDKVSDDDPESRVIVQFLRPHGSGANLPPGDLPDLPAGLNEGLQTAVVNRVSWRLFVKTLGADDRVAVGQQTVIREEVARDSALRTIMPLLLLIPVLLLLVGGLLRRMFSPLREAAAELDQRSEHDLAPVTDANLPSEVLPFVVAINRLLVRVAESMAVQRRFVADAAHELRSPLSALSLQAERLDATDMPTEARERLALLRKGIQRTRNLIEQLLSLVRVQCKTTAQPSPVSLQRVFRQVLEDLLPLAEAKNIDIGLLDERDCRVPGAEADLTVLVKNLLDNAIRYTPESGRIDLSVREGEAGVVLQIDDTGPGIPAEERKRVFDPFYRVLGNAEVGSGLGLSIVQTIANHMGADITLDFADQQARRGLRVQVTFPKPHPTA